EVLELLGGEAMVVTGEPHEPEVAGAHDGDRRFVGRRWHLLLVEVDDAVRGLARQGRPGDRRADALAPGDLGQHRVDERGALALRLRLDERGPPAHQVPDDLAEALAVALLERR